MRSISEDTAIQRLQLSAQQSQLSRRRLIQGAGLGLSTLALAACAGPGASGGIDISDTDNSLVWASWPSYIDRDPNGTSTSLLAFEDQTGISVDYRPIVQDNVGFYLTMKDQLSLGKPTGADIVCVSEWMAARLIRFGYAQKIDASNVPNKSNLKEEFASPAFDPNRDYSMPWQSGFIGLAWNNDEYPQGVQSVDQLWADDLFGKVVVLAEMRHTMGMLLLNEGIDISADDWGIEEYRTASAVLYKHITSKHIFEVMGSDYVEAFASGEAIAGFARAGDVVILNAEVGYKKFKFLLPNEGGTFFTDALVIPAGAQHKKNAEQLINFYYRTDIAMKVVQWIQTVSPVAGTLEAAQESYPRLASNQFIFPDETTMSMARTFRNLNSTDDQAFNAEFRRITGKG
jgi:spermidine/putrescine transport system substrate-binding protein